jgi:hypothetical protein
MTELQTSVVREVGPVKDQRCAAAVSRRGAEPRDRSSANGVLVRPYDRERPPFFCFAFSHVVPLTTRPRLVLMNVSLDGQSASYLFDECVNKKMRLAGAEVVPEPNARHRFTVYYDKSAWVPYSHFMADGEDASTAMEVLRLAAHPNFNRFAGVNMVSWRATKPGVRSAAGTLPLAPPRGPAGAADCALGRIVLTRTPR